MKIPLTIFLSFVCINQQPLNEYEYDYLELDSSLNLSTYDQKTRTHFIKRFEGVI